jgi:hypothetical protein
VFLRGRDKRLSRKAGRARQKRNVSGKAKSKIFEARAHSSIVDEVFEQGVAFVEIERRVLRRGFVVTGKISCRNAFAVN